MDSTALVESVDYCYINAKWHKGRVKMNVISINEIELFLDTSNIPIVEGGAFTWFCEYAYFEKLRPFLVISAWVRYSQLGKIQSTNAGLVQKNTDFSEFVGEKELGLYLQQWKRDLEFYKTEILKFIDAKCEINSKRSKVVFALMKKNEYKR